MSKTQETRHTPGPWRVSFTPLAPQRFQIRAGEFINRRICVMDDQPDDGDEANALLIAAAPELLEALKNLVHMVDNCDTIEPDDYQLHKASALIAKAEQVKP